MYWVERNFEMENKNPITVPHKPAVFYRRPVDS